MKSVNYVKKEKWAKKLAIKSLTNELEDHLVISVDTESLGSAIKEIDYERF